MKKNKLITFLFIWVCQLAWGLDIATYRFHTMPETSYYGGIQSISKDSLGRMWYTGPDALFMYDGQHFHQLNELLTTIAPTVKWGLGSLITDQQGRLFLTSNQGLLQFDYARFCFRLLQPGKIRAAALQEDGKLYMLSGDSLLRYDTSSHKVSGFALPNSGYFYNLMAVNGQLYAAQEGQLYEVDVDKQRFRKFGRFDQAGSTVNDLVYHRHQYYVLTQRNGIYVTDLDGSVRQHIPVSDQGNASALAKKLYLDPAGILWVATQDGLFLYDPTDGSRRFLRLNLNDVYSPPNNSIWTIYADPQQGAWIGTYGGKMAYCSLYDASVRYFNPSPGWLNHPVVSSFQEDPLGNIWIGTEGGGLNYWNRKTDSFQHYVKSTGNSVNSNMVKRLHWDAMGNRLLIAGFAGGMATYQPNRGIFDNLGLYYPQTQTPLTVYDFAEGDSGNLWMSDPDSHYLYKQSKQGLLAVQVKDAAGKALDLAIEALYIDKQGHLRLITHQGLFIVSIQTLQVLQHYRIDDASYVSNMLCSYYEASNGDLWLGTLGRGINILKRDGSYSRVGDRDGFTAKMVFGILEDEHTGNIWFSTNEGLFYFDASTKKYAKARFYQQDACGSFYIRAAAKTKKGEMLFGGTNGFVLFDPSNLNKNPQKPRVFFTAFMINNQLETATGSQSTLPNDISSLANNKRAPLQLSSKQSNIEIRFSTDSYLSADKNQFMYRMLGLSDNWMPLHSNQRSVQFFNLPQGDYTFEIKAANNDGVWSDSITRLYVHVDPPFFLSWWAYTLYSLLAIMLLYFIIRFYSNKKIFKERLALEALKEHNMRELNQARTDFFTQLSHDLKTPLTLVLQPLRQLKETLNQQESAGRYMQHIEKNVLRIQRMISQLLRFREIESQKITLHPQVGDFVNFVQEVFGLFELYANKKEIETTLSSQLTQLYVAFDYDIMEKILTNLFSNAIKYTPNKGYVGVRLYGASQEEIALLDRPIIDESLTYLSIEVLNSGDGFSEEQIATLYTSFNRLSPYKPSFEESTGLGLAIVKELLDVLQGKIWMVNKANQVSFTILLPLKKETGQIPQLPAAYDYTLSEIDAIIADTDTAKSSRPVRKANSLLLIEDDVAMRSYLEQQLSERYNVYTAADGTEGIMKAEKIYPQIVVTDLMMPHTTGFDVCSALRNNFKTSHIPIIMISGIGDRDENKVRALEQGATVFIDKPFAIDYLLQQIENILKTQRELKEKYSKRITVDPAKVTVTSMDEELLHRAALLLEQHMANASYSVEDFVADMSVGRTVLYQKFNDIVGMTIKEFMLNFRLKRSAYLLENSDLTIAEVAYETGFSNAKYFSVCFKKQFEISPSEFKKRHAV